MSTTRITAFRSRNLNRTSIRKKYPRFCLRQPSGWNQRELKRKQRKLKPTIGACLTTGVLFQEGGIKTHHKAIEDTAHQRNMFTNNKVKTQLGKHWLQSSPTHSGNLFVMDTHTRLVNTPLHSFWYAECSHYFESPLQGWRCFMYSNYHTPRKKGDSFIEWKSVSLIETGCVVYVAGLIER